MSSVKTGSTIANIAKKKSGAVLYLEDGRKIALSFDSFTEDPLYVGKALSEKEIQHLVDLSKNDALFAYALKLCLSDSKTEREIQERLAKKDAKPESIRLILARLKGAGLIDDPSYAAVYRDDVAALRCYGKRRVLFDLSKKGIPESILSSLSFPREEELSRAIRYAELLNKRASKVPNSRKKPKMIQGLIERGFEEDIAREAVEQAATKNDEEEERNALAKDYFAYKVHFERKYDGYALRQKILAALMRKGYRYEDIERLEMEENHDC